MSGYERLHGVPDRGTSTYKGRQSKRILRISGSYKELAVIFRNAMYTEYMYMYTGTWTEAVKRSGKLKIVIGCSCWS